LPDIEKYKTLFPNFDWMKYKAPEGLNLPFHFTPFHYTDLKLIDGNEYHGYFQSEKFFPDHYYIKWLFQPNDEVRDIILDYNDELKGNTCSIHVRRNDYLLKTDQFPNYDMSYYDKAINTVESKTPIDRYLVFSDDLLWCIDNFIGEKFVFVEDKDYIALFIMAKCKHHIVSNSSFAWWGAWLGEDTDSIVVAPSPWITKEELNVDDIIPERWVKL
jgi:hypothetical protein